MKSSLGFDIDDNELEKPKAFKSSLGFDITDEDFVAPSQSKEPAAVEKLSLADRVVNTIKAGGKGVTALPSTPGSDLELFGRKVRMGLQSLGGGIGELAAMTEIPGVKQAGRWVADTAADVRESIEGSIPQEQKPKNIFTPESKILEPDTWKTTEGLKLRDIVLQGSEQAAQFLPGITTSAATKGMSVIGKIIAQAGVGAGQSAGVNAAQSYQEVMEMPEEILETSPEYNELKKSFSPKEARQRLATSVRNEVALKTAPLGAAAGPLEFVLPSALAGKTLTRALKGAGVSAMTEGPQEISEELVQNLAQRRADPSIDPQRGLLEAGAMAGIVGGIPGAYSAVSEGGKTKQEADYNTKLKKALDDGINEIKADLGIKEQSIEEPAPEVRAVLEKAVGRKLTEDEWDALQKEAAELKAEEGKQPEPVVEEKAAEPEPVIEESKPEKKTTLKQEALKARQKKKTDQVADAGKPIIEEVKTSQAEEKVAVPETQEAVVETKETIPETIPERSDIESEKVSEVRGDIKGKQMPSVQAEGVKKNWEMTKAEFINDYSAGIPDSSGPKARAQALKDFEINHRMSVEDAIKEGKPVPAEVLADYPDLQKGVIQNERKENADAERNAEGQRLQVDQFADTGKMVAPSAPLPGPTESVSLPDLPGKGEAIIPAADLQQKQIEANKEANKAPETPTVKENLTVQPEPVKSSTPKQDALKAKQKKGKGKALKSEMDEKPSLSKQEQLKEKQKSKETAVIPEAKPKQEAIKNKKNKKKTVEKVGEVSPETAVSTEAEKGVGSGAEEAKKARQKEANEKQKGPSKRKKAETVDRLKEIRDFYTPGNIVTGYAGQRDKVLDFQDGEQFSGGWNVKVQEIDKDGNLIGRPRNHATPPSRGYRVVSRAEKAVPENEGLNQVFEELYNKRDFKGIILEARNLNFEQKRKYGAVIATAEKRLKPKSESAEREIDRGVVDAIKADDYWVPDGLDIWSTPEGEVARKELEDAGEWWGAKKAKETPEAELERAAEEEKQRKAQEGQEPMFSKKPYTGPERRNQRKYEVPRPDGKADRRDTPSDIIGLSPEEIQTSIRDIVKKWANSPKIEVVESDKELPGNIQDFMESSGGVGAIEGLMDPASNTIYLISNNLASAKRAQEVLFHEAFGHYGVRGLLGDNIRIVLNRVYLAKTKEAKEIAKQYGIDLSTLEGKRQAAEEVLARMAERGEKSNLLEQAYTAIRQWLRSMGFKLVMTNAELRTLISLSRRYVEEGKGSRIFPSKGAGGVITKFKPAINFDDEPATYYKVTFEDGSYMTTSSLTFAQKLAQDRGVGDSGMMSKQKQTDTPAFKKWFGNSVVTVDGKAGSEPLVVYHGTDSKEDITGFKVPTYFAENPDEASAYAFPGEFKQKQKLLNKYRHVQANGTLDGKLVEYVGIIDDITNKGEVWATDQGVARVNKNGTIDIFTDVVMSEGGFDMDTMTQTLETGESAAYDEIAEDIKNITANLRGEGGRVYPVYISMQNPKTLSPMEGNRFGSRLGFEKEGAETVEKLKAEGYDGIITTSDEVAFYYDLVERTDGKIKQYIPFSPTQIKSATGNQGTFDPKNPDIRFSRAKDIAPVTSDFEAVRKRRDAARGIKSASALDKVKGAWESIKRHKEHFAALNYKTDGKMIDAFRRAENIPTSSRDEAIRKIRGILRDIPKHRNKMRLFEDSIGYDDMAWDIERGKYQNGLPFGYESVDQFRQDKAKIDAAVTQNPDIAEAKKRRTEIMNDIRKQLVDSDIMPESILADDRYFHHQVLQYMAVTDVGEAYQPTVAGLRDKKYGWMKARKGSAQDYNTSYVQSEYEVMAQAIASIERKKTLDELKEFDITRKLKAQAKAEGIDDWKALIPKNDETGDNYVEWQPEKGNHYYSAWTLNEKVLDQLLTDIDTWDNNKTFEELMESNEVRKILAIGGKKETWIIPQRMKTTIEKFSKAPDEVLLSKWSRQTLSGWKAWTLLNPIRVVRYMLNNVSGDADIVLAYNRDIFREMNGARRDLWADLKGRVLDKNLAAELSNVRKKAVIGSGLTISELPSSHDSDIQNYLSGHTMNLPKAYWKWVTQINELRENVLRLAAYRYFKKELAKGGQLYGASNKAEIDKITDLDNKAAKLARELIGDYGNISEAGQWVRAHMIPFWSFQEINAPRYYRLLKNLKHEGKGAGQVGGVMAWKATKLGLKASILFAMISLWNAAFWPDEEEELGEQGRKQLHIILGRNEDGSIRTLRMQGALSEALSWFGLENFPQDYKDVVSGKVSWSKKFEETYKAPVNKLALGSLPFHKSGFELASGRQFFPDAFKPRPIRDKIEHAFRTLSLDMPYRYFSGKPSKGMADELSKLLTYKTDPGEASYYDSMTLVRDYLEEQGAETPDISPTKKSNALYYYKQAKKYGDKKAQDKYLQEYFSLGGRRQDLMKSVRRADPLAILPIKYRGKFMKSLDADEKDTFKKGRNWWRETYMKN